MLHYHKNDAQNTTVMVIKFSVHTTDRLPCINTKSIDSNNSYSQCTTVGHGIFQDHINDNLPWQSAIIPQGFQVTCARELDGINSTIPSSCPVASTLYGVKCKSRFSSLSNRSIRVTIWITYRKKLNQSHRINIISPTEEARWPEYGCVDYVTDA